MTLVLLSSFNDSDESIVGFTLCRKLAEEGSQLYVTTTSTGEALGREVQTAEEINRKSKGSISLLQPQSEGHPDAEWIVKHHAKYFSYLQKLPDVETVVGIFPGTEQSAIELKEALNCNLKFLAHREIEVKGSERENFRILLEQANEIWTLGSHIHIYYKRLLQNFKVSCEKLKNLSFQPFIKSTSWVKSYPTQIGKSSSERNFVSVWRNSYSQYHLRKVTEVKGSNVENYFSLALTLNEIGSDEERSINPRWMIYPLSSKDWNSLKERAKSYDFELSTFTSISSEMEAMWKRCSAFIAPEVQDESFNFAAFTAMSYGIPTFVSSQSAVGKFLLELNSPLTSRVLVDLTGDVITDSKIWMKKLSTEILEEAANPTQWANKLGKHLEKSLLPWQLRSMAHTNVHKSLRPGMILVLLHRFSDSQESCLGYQLCQKLVKEGYHLLVSTISCGKRLKLENQRAKWLTDTFSGSVTLLVPQYGEKEEPSVEWIEHPSSKYFLHLSQLQNVILIFGMLPGTSQTAVELKKQLDLDCKLVLLATAMIGSEKEDLKEEICLLSEKAEEIWSVGNETYFHFQSMFQELRPNSCDKHKEILLQPLALSNPSMTRNSQTPRWNIISVCRKPVPFFYEGNKVYLKGSNITSFYVVGRALEKIEKEFEAKNREAMQWHIYGSTAAEVLQSLQRLKKLKIKAHDEIATVDDVPWTNYKAFIAPDVTDNSFNFAALCALWLGVPTLVSSQSSIGKFLISLSCPAKTRAVVALNGDRSDDTSTWIEKINTHILDKDAKPKQWAGELSEYLQNNLELSEIDFSGLRRNTRRRHSSSSNAQLYVEQTDLSTTSGYLSTADQATTRQRSQGRRRELRREWSFASQLTSESGTTSTWSTASSAGLTLDLEHSNPNYQFKECQDHKGFLMNFFCRDCNTSICSLCNSSLHRDHVSVPLIEKVEEDRSDLRTFLDEGGNRATEAEKRERNISLISKQVEMSVSAVEQRVSQQYEHVRKELEVTYKEELDEIQKRARKDIRKLTEELDEIRKFSKEWKDIEERVKAMLQEEGSSEFIDNVFTFFQNNERVLDKGWHERSIKRMQYIEPVYKQTGEGKDFQTHLREHLLGFVTPNQRMKIRSRQHSPLSHMSSPRRPENRSPPSPIYPHRLKSPELDARSSVIYTPQRHSPITGNSSIPPAANMRVELISYANVGKTEGLNLKRFYGASFMDDSMWICGWSRDGFGPNYTAFYKVDVPDYHVLQKNKMWFPQGDQLTIVCTFGKFILFAKKGGNEVYSFDGRQFSTLNLEPTKVTAICFSNKYFYIFDNRYPHQIRFFDPNSKHHGGEMPTGLGNVEKCDIHMCLILDRNSDKVTENTRRPRSAEQKPVSNETIILSCSYPHAAVIAVNQANGVLWQLDCRTHRDLLDLSFNPRSVSAAESGNIFIADRGSNKIYTVSKDGTNLNILLTKGLENLVEVQVDRDGRKLLAIIKDGTQIRNYKLNMQ